MKSLLYIVGLILCCLGGLLVGISDHAASEVAGVICMYLAGILVGLSMSFKLHKKIASWGDPDVPKEAQ